MKYHTTREGKKIKLKDLDLDHLKNIINYIEKKAEEGVLIRCGGGSTPEDFWYDEDLIIGDEALVYLNYKVYKKELKRRESLREILNDSNGIDYQDIF